MACQLSYRWGLHNTSRHHCLPKAHIKLYKQTHQFEQPHTCWFESKLAAPDQGTPLALGLAVGFQCSQHEVPEKGNSYVTISLTYQY